LWPEPFVDDGGVGTPRHGPSRHLFGNVPIKQGVERYFVGAGIFRALIQFKELNFDLLPDSLFGSIERGFAGHASRPVPRNTGTPMQNRFARLTRRTEPADTCPTYLHSATSEVYLESSLPYHGLLWVGRISNRDVSC
jgi:hypothetical protein